MVVEKEAILGEGRIDYLIRLRVGIEVKNIEELASTREVIAQVSRYMSDVHALILFVNASMLSNVAVDHVRRLCTMLLPGAIVAYGNFYNPHTWRAICDVSLLDVVKRAVL